MKFNWKYILGSVVLIGVVVYLLKVKKNKGTIGNRNLGELDSYQLIKMLKKEK